MHARATRVADHANFFDRVGPGRPDRRPTRELCPAGAAEVGRAGSPATTSPRPLWAAGGRSGRWGHWAGLPQRHELRSLDRRTHRL